MVTQMKIRDISAAACAGAAVLAAAFHFIGPAEAADDPRIVSFRRLTESEYRNSVADIFGQNIQVQGRFEPEVRIGGLLASSTSTLSITAAGFQSYARMADSIAKQVVSPENRARLISCKPKAPDAPDDKCATIVLREYGTRAFRRPLSDEELKSRVAFAAKVSKSSKDFYTGLHYSLASVLSSPAFLFRTESAVPAAEGYTLDGYSRATRLSYLLWGTTPDAELLKAAKSGDLSTEAGLAKQVDRLLASPNLERGMRTFFSDFLAPDYYGNVTKDKDIYPKWSDYIADSAKEESLRTVIDVTLKQDGDLRDILTTRKTFLNRPLAAMYKVPFSFESEWQPYEFAADAGRSGVLTQLSVLAMFSHPGRSSPTERGKAVLDIFMCSPTPPPPANVDFAIINGAGNPNLKTVRQRLLAHATAPSCKSCHNHMDPIGLSLENFDSTGQYRTHDNGEPIDASATLSGKSFAGAEALGKALHDEPRFPACVARKLYSYGVGTNSQRVRPPQYKTALDSFVASDYRLRALLRAMATSPEFFVAAPPPAAAPAPAVASAESGRAAASNGKVVASAAATPARQP
jgi:hypothetical protein